MGGAEMAAAAAFTTGASAVVTALDITVFDIAFIPFGETGFEEFGPTRGTGTPGLRLKVRFFLAMICVYQN